MAASQLTGYPGNAVSISMLDWKTGEGNAWYWVVKMFIDTLGSVPKDVVSTLVNGRPSNTTITALRPDQWMCIHSPPNSKAVNDAHTAPLYAQSFQKGADRMVLLVNTKNCSAEVSVDGAAGGSVRAVDSEAGYASIPYSQAALASDSYTLRGWGVALVTLPRDPVAKSKSDDDESALCPVLEQSNNIAGMLPPNAGANASTDIVKHLGVVQSEAECRAACQAAAVCRSWTWHHLNFPSSEFAGHCYARLDDAWPPRKVGKPVSSQWMGAHAGHCEPFVPGPSPAVRFSWDTVPVFLHSDNVTGPFTDEAIEFIAKRFAMVTIEKYQGPNAGGENKVWRPEPGVVECCEEDRIVANLRRMKQVNKNLTTILYLNSILDFPQYRLHELIKARPSLWLNTSEGTPLMMSGDGHPHQDMMAYDMTNPIVRELFKEACLNYTKDGTVDGCFIDVRAILSFHACVFRFSDQKGIATAGYRRLHGGLRRSRHAGGARADARRAAGRARPRAAHCQPRIQPLACQRGAD